MPLVTQVIHSLYGGVSQQSPVLRGENQCESAVNCTFSIADGVSKRPPLETINELTSVDLTGTFCHWIADRNNDQYLVVINAVGDVSIYRTSDGQKLNVTNDTAVPYLVSADPVSELRAYTVEEKTYLVNTTITVEADAQVTGGTLAGSVATLQDDALNSAGIGTIWEIMGDTENAFDTYYSKKITSTKWVEWVRPNIQDKIKPDTMPYHIELFFDEVDPFGVRFEIKEGVWKNREVGDTKSNKFPSFIDSPITGLFFSNDRLSFLSNSSVVMSETGEHDNFWRTTITDVLATDRIDVKESSDDSTSFYYAKPLGRNIMTFSANKQWTLTGDPVLTPQTVGMTLATAYQSSPLCEPQNAGTSLFFCVNTGNRTEVREMFVSEDSISSTATNVTAHVPDYIPKNVRLMAVQNNLDFLVLYSDEERKNLYVNNYKYSGGKKVQSAWSTWELDPSLNIVNIKTINSYLYVVYTQTLYNGSEDVTKTYLGKINLKNRDPGVATGFDHPLHLECLEKLEGTYDAPTHTTSFATVSRFLSPDLLDRLIIVKGEGWSDKGRYIHRNYPSEFYMTSDESHFYISGDWTTGDLYIGLPYMQEFEFSPLYYKENGKANIDVRCQIRHMVVSFTESATFKTSVVSRGSGELTDNFYPQLTHTYTARTLGDDYFKLNEPKLITGTYQFPVLSQNKDVTISIKNDSYMPCNLQSAQFKALISSRLR